MVHLKFLGAKLAEFEPQIIKMCFFARAAHVRINRPFQKRGAPNRSAPYRIAVVAVV